LLLTFTIYSVDNKVHLSDVNRMQIVNRRRPTDHFVTKFYKLLSLSKRDEVVGGSRKLRDDNFHELCCSSKRS
jgi:hypothetical protein